MSRGFGTLNRRQLPCAYRWSARVLRICATPRRMRWEHRRRGMEASPLDVAIVPDRLREAVCGVPGAKGQSARQITFPLNLRAQCKQPRNFCQAKTDEKAQNVVAPCSKCLPLVVMFQSDTRREIAARGDHSGFLALRPYHT